MFLTLAPVGFCITRRTAIHGHIAGPTISCLPSTPQPFPSRRLCFYSSVGWCSARISFAAVSDISYSSLSTVNRLVPRLMKLMITLNRWGETLSSRDLLAPPNNPIRLNGNIKSRDKSGFDGVSPYPVKLAFRFLGIWTLRAGGRRRKGTPLRRIFCPCAVRRTLTRKHEKIYAGCRDEFGRVTGSS